VCPTTVFAFPGGKVQSTSIKPLSEAQVAAGPARGGRRVSDELDLRRGWVGAGSWPRSFPELTLVHTTLARALREKPRGG